MAIAELAASAYNQLQWTNMPAVLVTPLLWRGTRRFCTIAVATTIAGTHYAYPQRDGQAELVSLASECIAKSVSVSSTK